MTEKRTCYILTPVVNENDPVKRHMDGIINAVLMPVLSDDFEVIVDYRIPNSGYINKQVIQRIYHSDLVIANLSDKNSNVMYQLAFRHSIGTPVIMIAEEGTIIPCFFNDKIIFYVNDAQGVLDLIEKLICCLESIDFAKVKESPIYDSLRLKEEYIVQKTENEFEPLNKILKEDEIAEINESEYSYFKSLLKDESNTADTIQLEYDKDFQEKEIIVDDDTEIEPERDIDRVDSKPETMRNMENGADSNNPIDNSIITAIKRIISKIIDGK